MIKARLVGKEIADDTKKEELFAGTPGLLALRYLVSKLATNRYGEERICARVMDAKVLSYKVVLDDPFSSRFPQKAEGASWMECWQNGWDHCTGHVMLQ